MDSFGVDDKTHELTNTNFNKVKKQISDNTTDNVGFIEIYEFKKNNNRVIMFQVPAAPLTSNKIEQIKATVDNLDKDAIRVAREQFKIKYKGKNIADEIDELSDIDFLNKAKLTLDNKITMACMLLLGKNEDDGDFIMAVGEDYLEYKEEHKEHYMWEIKWDQVASFDEFRNIFKVHIDNQSIPETVYNYLKKM